MTTSLHRHQPVVGIVLPARNESLVMERCLESIARQECDACIRVAVCVNGTTDDTASIARAAAGRIECRDSLEMKSLEIAVSEVAHASKTAALNAGDAWLGEVDVWIYLDADVELSRNAVGAICAALDSDAPLIAQPARTIAADTKSWGRLGAWALLTLPWVADDIACGGIFAVNRAGRSRWRAYPRIAADDAFVIGQFAAHERRVVRECWATHPMPSTRVGLLKQQRRWGEARCALEASEYRPPHGSSWSASRRVRALLCSPSAVIAAMIVRVIRMESARTRSSLDSDSWTVDRSAQ